MLTRLFNRAAASGLATLSEFLAFLRRPDLEAVERSPIQENWIAILWFFILSMAITFAFGLIALPFIAATDLAAGEQLKTTFGAPIWSIILSVILLGPLVEEILFRGWLPGSWRVAFTSALALGAVYGGAALLDWILEIGEVARQVTILALALTILAIASRFENARAIPGYRRIFPVIFYLQAGAFGLLHFGNYAASSPATAVLATMPLVICGLIWGYARVRYGLASAVLLHSAYNVPAAVGSVIFMRQ